MDHSSDGLFKAFVSPFAATAGQVGNSYAASLIVPPPPAEAPPEPPTLYLPAQGPVVLGTSWKETGHILLTWLSITSLALGAGVVLGLGASTCAGQRKEPQTPISSEKSEEEYSSSSDNLSLGSEDPEKRLKQTIIQNIG